MIFLEIQNILQVALTSLISLAVMFILTKLMGYKQLSQLSMFDYINGITIGSIAAEMATELEKPLYPLTAMVVYAVITFIISIVSCKSIHIRRFFTGKSIILVDGGKIFQKNLLRARIDVNDLLTQCRINGYFNLSDIQMAIMEQSGAISFLPKSQTRPITPSDIGTSPTQELPAAVVILDGNILERNLKSTGKDVQWLKKQTHSQGYGSIKEILLASCDIDDNLSVYPKSEEKLTGDMFC